MRRRYSELESGLSIATAGTKQYDIDYAEIISGFFIQVRLTGTNTAPTGHPALTITKIEVVDGSDVLFSMKGIAVQALEFLLTGNLPLNVMHYLNDVQCIATFFVPFGRFPFDREFALNPQMFKNPQLKITHNYALGGSTPDAAEMQVYALLFGDDPPSPRGFLMSKQIYDYALASSGVEWVDLPLDYPYRNLMFQSRIADKAPHSQFATIKLTEDQDKFIIVDESVSNLNKMIPQNAVPIYEDVYFVGALTAVTVYCTPSMNIMVVANSEADATYCDTSLLTQGVAASIAASGLGNIHAIVKGWHPHGAMLFPFGDQNDPDDWYDPTGKGSVKAKITAGSSIGSGSTLELIAQQVRTA